MNEINKLEIVVRQLIAIVAQHSCTGGHGMELKVYGSWVKSANAEMQPHVQTLCEKLSDEFEDDEIGIWFNTDKNTGSMYVEVSN